MESIKFVAKFGIILATMIFSGCATILHGTTQDIQINTKPEGAIAKATSGLECTTPCKLTLKRKQDHLITISKDGYDQQTVTIQHVISGAVAGNILAGGLIGWGVDAASGGQYRLIPELVNIELKPLVRSLEKPGTLIEKSLPDKEVYRDMGTEKKKTSFYSFEEIKEWHNAVKDREWKKISESEGITLCYDSRNISYPSKSIVRVFTLETFESKKAINDKINHFRQLGLSTKGYENLYGTLTLQEINCNNKMYLPIYFMDYDKNRNPLNQSYDLSSNGWSEISSTMPTPEKLYQAVCPGGK